MRQMRDDAISAKRYVVHRCRQINNLYNKGTITVIKHLFYLIKKNNSTQERQLDTFSKERKRIKLKRGGKRRRDTGAMAFRLEMNFNFDSQHRVDMQFQSIPSPFSPLASYYSLVLLVSFFPSTPIPFHHVVFASPPFISCADL